ncbi:CobW family GTP-binding protein [Pseudonocardia sp. CA-107938]|uniref:CobW family GTP-binding protein n=1 Tax=Pseudonocardia sp. CA-107938 TaxID=3240021 RepID=UPI003D8CA93A
MRRRVPVLVLAGFLGAGKTTLLNHLLTHSRDTRIGVVVNDFGSVGVDAMLVGRAVGGVVPIGNGCLCCATDEAGFAPLLARLTGPRSGIDVVVVEASGIAEPDRLVALVQAATGHHALFGGLVEVVDTAEFEDVRRLHTELDRHVGLADLVVLNKSDLAGPERTERVRQLARAANQRAPIVVTNEGAVDPRLLYEVTETPGRQLMLAQLDDHDHDHLHDGYRAVALSADRPLDPAALVAFLRDRAPDAYRVKGFADLGDGRPRHVVHAVGRQLRLERTPWPRGAARRTTLEVIGRDLDEPALVAGLRACEREDPAAADDLAVLDPFVA